MNKEIPEVKTEVERLDIYNFKNGKIRRDGISWAGEKYSAYRVDEGQFKCQTCGRIFGKNDDVLPVNWDGKITNFVCIYDRGLFDQI